MLSWQAKFKKVKIFVNSLNKLAVAYPCFYNTYYTRKSIIFY